MTLHRSSPTQKVRPPLHSRVRGGCYVHGAHPLLGVDVAPSVLMDTATDFVLRLNVGSTKPYTARRIIHNHGGPT